jgi:hypothetical protein
LLFLFAVIALIGWAVVLLLPARRRLSVRQRMVMRWIALAQVLIESGVVLSATANQRHWTLHHSALGAIALLLPVAGLACLVMAVVSWRRRPRRRSA